MIEIGDAEIPIVNEISESRDANIDEIKDAFKYNDVVPVQHEAKPISLTIFGYLNSELHSDNYTLGEQRTELKKLQRNSDTIFLEFKDYYGFFIVENVNIPEDSERKIIRSVEIEGSLHPYPKYQ